MTDAPRGYEIWDGLSGNLVMDFHTEQEALAFIRGEIETDEAPGEDPMTGWWQHWALVAVADTGRSTVVAEGRELLQRARSQRPSGGSPRPSARDGAS